MAGKLQIQESFQKVYDLEVFKREILNSVFTSEKAKLFREENYIDESNQLTASEKKVILKVIHYGNLELDDYNTLKLYEITLQPKVRIEQSKVGIQQYVRKMLIAGEGVLVNFINPDNLKTWRLTLVASDTVLTDKGISVKKLNPKRYSFIVGQSEKCKTISDRFAELEKATRIVLYPSENEKSAISLVNIFSVETLSKAFFDEYTLHYKLFTEYIQNSNFRKSIFNISIPQDAKKEELDIAYKPIRDFVKKMLGRIVFLYFVQKKGWLGATNTDYIDGSDNFIFQLFEKSGSNENFYYEWLSKLFFETLNKQRIDDVFVMPDSTFVKIPYLNGGLFDPEEYDNKLLTFIPTLFHSNDFEDTPLTEKIYKKNEPHRGFLDFLNAFNFTVYEDSPEDHTVAVDPEMLGHIFENLLEDNKDKGAFYTPKEIVHYMCQESLMEYLKTHIKEVDEIELVNLVKNKNITENSKLSLNRINDLLVNVKICDPAIGSGAFPMGLLQEIFALMELIAVHTNQNFDAGKTKENIIQNSIYGVDIEKGAVDIARLRFWLSLIVNEEKPKALPNLDYKIVVGDSLLSKFEDEVIEINWDKTGSVGKADEYVKNVQRLLKEVARKQKDYFNEEGKSKKAIANEIRDLKIDLLINQLSFNKESYTNKNSVKIDNGLGLSSKDLRNNELILKEIYNFDKNIKKLIELKKDSLKSFNHFDWKLDFPEVLNPYLFENKDNVGFDIVIANPPYIDSETMVSMGNSHVRDYLTKKLNFCKGNWDIYIAFFDVSFHFLNPTGNLVFITPDKWISKPFGNEIRIQLLENYIKIAEAGRDVFKNAKVDSIITFIGKYKTENLEIDKFYNNTVTHIDTVSKSNIVEPYTFDWLFSDYISLIKKIEIFPSKLKEYGICENACSTSDAYKLKEYILDLNDTFDSDEYLKIINTGTISKYVSRWGHSEMTYLKDKLHPEKQFKYLKPVVNKKDFLKNFNNSYSKKSIKPKIIIKGLTLLDACVDIDGIIIPGKSTLLITKELEHSNELYLLLGLVNSKIFIFYIKEKYRGSSYNTGINFNMDMINDVPVPLISENNKLLITQIVKYIIFSKENINVYQNDLILNYFEQIIDGMVYELYFPELLQQHNRTIIEHLGELPAITNSMNDNQKMEIITTVFNRLNEKNHPVRVNLFYMNSIPEIAIIEGKKEETL